MISFASNLNQCLQIYLVDLMSYRVIFCENVRVFFKVLLKWKNPTAVSLKFSYFLHKETMRVYAHASWLREKS